MARSQRCVSVYLVHQPAGAGFRLRPRRRPLHSFRRTGDRLRPERSMRAPGRQLRSRPQAALTRRPASGTEQVANSSSIHAVMRSPKAGRNSRDRPRSYLDRRFLFRCLQANYCFRALNKPASAPVSAEFSAGYANGDFPPKCRTQSFTKDWGLLKRSICGLRSVRNGSEVSVDDRIDLPFSNRSRAEKWIA